MDREAILVLGRPEPPLLETLNAGAADFEVAVGERLEEFAAAAPEATIVLCWTASRDLLREVLRISPRLRWVHVASAGINHLVSDELMRSPVQLTNAKGVFSPSLGEWALGAILYFAKDFRRLIRAQAQGVWEPFEVVAIAGRTVGIVGYGDIGRQVASRVDAMGMRVLGLTRHGVQPGRDYSPAEEVFGPEGLIPMIEQSDYVVVTAPLTSDTRGLIGEAEIAAMRPDAVIINIGRGPIVKEATLLGALIEGRIKGAALDVFDHEPLPTGHPFYSLENVLLSPHSADHTPDWLDNTMQFFLDNLARYRRGEALANLVEKGRSY